MHRNVSEKGIKLIKDFEGLSLVPYFCGAGYLTIGYGHKLQHNEEIKNIKKDDADELFFKDLRQTERSVIKLINTTLNDNQFSALVSFTYNLGAAALQRSTLRQKINRRQSGASDEFLRWVYVRGIISLGLTRRRVEERKLYVN